MAEQAEQGQQLRVFVSHSSQDDAFCRTVVTALRGAGADVWYDEQNLGAGVLRREIMRELAARPVFLVILSKAAFASRWVQDECEWAYNIYLRKPARLILPVVAAPCDPDDFDTLLYLESMKRVETGSLKPYSPAEAPTHLLRMLALTPRGEAPAPTAPQPTESADDLLTRGKALNAQRKFAEALPLFERATQIAPGSISAWMNLGYTFRQQKKGKGALDAYEHAIALDENQANAWTGKGLALIGLKCYDKALIACIRATELQGGTYAYAWNGKGNALRGLKRYQEALEAFDGAIARMPRNPIFWGNKGLVLRELERFEAALEAFDHVLQLAPNDAGTWNSKGNTLYDLGRYQDALVAYERALALNSNYANYWAHKAATLHRLGRTAEAEEAERRAKELGWKG